MGTSSLDLLDPTPSIHDLFAAFNEQYFRGRLGSVTVEWSKRMTLCAGLCYYQGPTGGCRIKLSEPLLSYRPRSDLINTILHEMIHAYIFIVNGRHRLDRDGHGPDFQEIMHRINASAGTSISVYHTFHDEVDYHKKHWWRCDGACKNRSPFFGYVKRAMNRAPGPNDNWWNDHKANCSGNFIKIKEPEPKPKPTKVKGESKKAKVGKDGPLSSPLPKGTKAITNFFKKTGSESPSSQATTQKAQGNKNVDEVVILDSDEEDADLKLAIALSLGEDVSQTPSGDQRLDPPPPKIYKPSPTATSTVTSASASNSSSSPISTTTNNSNNKGDNKDESRFPGAGYRLGAW